MSNNSEKYFGKKILQLLTSNIVFFVIFILYVIILAVVLVREFHISNFRATNQFLIILGFLFIPLFLISALGYVLRNFEHINIELGETQKVEFKKYLKNEVTTELVENISASTESTLYSLASFMIVEPKTYRQKARGDSKQIIVGCQDYTEQRILCAIITELLNINKEKLDPNLKVIPKYNLGGVALNFVALSRGDIDIYPAYTWQGYEMYYGTYLSQKRESLIKKPEPDSTEANERISDLNNLYTSLSIPLKWICYTGFHDNWNIVVRKDSDTKEIKSVSQLKNKNNLILGCEYDFFARPNGYRLLTNPEPNGYGLKFEKITLIKHKDAYEALQKKEVDIIDGFTTDPQINYSNFKILEDDEKQFGRYYSSILVRKQLLEDRPKLESILQLLRETITSDKMTEMIQKIDEFNTDEYYEKIKETAKKFVDDLPNHGKLEDEGEATGQN